MSKKPGRRTPASSTRVDFSPPPPPGEGAECRAQYILSLLDELEKQGTMEARRLRQSIITVVNDYRAKAESMDKAKAIEEFKLELVGLEIGAAEILTQTTRKLRDRVSQAVRRLGT